MLSDEDKAEMLRDGLNPLRREAFRMAEAMGQQMTMELYLQWLADMERWSPAPPPAEIKRYAQVLL
jgi:hypothetical protein